MEHHAADQLDIEVYHVPGVLVVADHELHADHAAGGILHDGEGLGQDLVQPFLQEVGILDQGELGFPGGRLVTEGLVGKGLQAGFNFVDLGDERDHPAHFALVLGADDFFENPGKHEKRPCLGKDH